MSKTTIKGRYGVTPIAILNDPNLSLKAKGLFGYIQSKPDGWKFSVKLIASQTSEGVKSVSSTVQELEEHGYLNRIKSQDDRGHWVVEYVLEEFPTPQNPISQNPISDYRVSEKGINISNIDISKKDKVNKRERASSSIKYLSEIPVEDIQEFSTKFNCKKNDIIGKAQQLIDWCETNGKTKKNYKAFLRTAIRKDFGERKQEVRL